MSWTGLLPAHAGAYQLEKANCVYVSSQFQAQWCPVSGLKPALVGVFIPWESTKAKIRAFY